MKVVQTLCEITTEALHCLFGKLFFLLNKLKEVSTSAILKDDPQMVSCLVPVEET